MMAWLLTTSTTTTEAAGVYMPQDMFYLDQKIDDGKPITGQVLAGSNTLEITDTSGTCSTTSYGTSTNTDACIDDNNYTYNAGQTGASATSLCYGVFKAPF